MKYNKPAKTIDELVEGLISRGLVVPNRGVLEHDIKHIGYFRLTGYMYPYQIKDENRRNTHVFEDGTRYEQIQAEYRFDRALRRLYEEAIEHIEIFMRSSISDHMSLNHNAFWFKDSKLFLKSLPHARLLTNLNVESEKSSEKYMRHFKAKYTEEEYPPSWTVFELLSLGSLSMLYKNLNDKDCAQIANYYELQSSTLKSWLHALSYVRNICAHHNRLWNRYLTLRIKTGGFDRRFYINENNGIITNSVYAITVAIVHLMHFVNPTPRNPWFGKLKALMEEYEQVDISRMGFGEDWENKILS